MAPRDADIVAGSDDSRGAADKTNAERVASEELAAANAKRKARRRYAIIGLVSLAGPIAALAVGLYIYLAGGRYISTDNAYIKSEKIAVSADIAGRVVRVAVHENQIVEPGEVLFQVDPRLFRIALERAEAKLTAARHSVVALKAVYRQKQASLLRANGEVEFHRQQLNRQEALSRRNLVSGLNLDTATRNLRDGQDQVRVAEQALAEALAKIGGDPEVAVPDHPAVREAQAVRDEAALELERTTVRATMRGVVTNFDLQPGEYLRPGAPVFSLVGAGSNWVHAHYKETELTHVRVGQPATIHVDTYPGRVFEATVEGISPATGAEFAVLPPQNATGNWVKVVQRLTVRLKLKDPDGAGTAETQDGGDGAAIAQERTTAARKGMPFLRAGMSAHVEIDTGHQRKLTGMLGTVTGLMSGRTSGAQPGSS